MPLYKFVIAKYWCKSCILKRSVSICLKNILNTTNKYRLEQKDAKKHKAMEQDETKQ